MILLGLALLVASDLADQRAEENKPLSNWWLVPILLGQLLTMVPGVKLGIALLPQFPCTTILAFDLFASVLHVLLGFALGLAAISLLQQLSINLCRRFTGLPLNPIDWPYAAAIKSWFVDRDKN